MEIKQLGPCDYFEEGAFVFNKPRRSTVVAQDTLKCLKIDRGKLERIIGSFHDFLKNNLACVKSLSDESNFGLKQGRKD